MASLSFWFKFHGRIGRGAFALGSIIALIAGNVMAIAIGGNPLGPQPSVAPVMGLVASVPIWALAVRRYHDLDMSGWWSLLPIGAVCSCFLALLTAFAAIPDRALMPLVPPLVATSVGLSIVSLWHAVKLCFFTGTPGDNRFGPAASTMPDPLHVVEGQPNGAAWTLSALASIQPPGSDGLASAAARAGFSAARRSNTASSHWTFARRR